MISVPLTVLLAEGPRQTGPDFGKASPAGLVITLILLIAVIGLIWSMNRHLRKLPESFDPAHPEPDQAVEGHPQRADRRCGRDRARPAWVGFGAAEPPEEVGERHAVGHGVVEHEHHGYAAAGEALDDPQLPQRQAVVEPQTGDTASRDLSVTYYSTSGAPQRRQVLMPARSRT